jgi:hypothetical protein
MEIPFKIKKPTNMPTIIWAQKDERFVKANNNTTVTLEVCGLTEEEALEYAELWKETFMNHWSNISGTKRRIGVTEGHVGITFFKEENE